MTPEFIERLLPAYRVLLGAALQEKAAAEGPPGGHKEGAAPSNATPGDVDLNPDQEVSACPIQV